MSDLSWLNPTPHAIAVYASRPLSPVATQHSLPSGRYSLLGPDFHRLEIERIMIDKISGKVAYAVMSFGGFVGIGEDYYPLPWSLLTYNTRLEGYEVNVSEQQLNGAPKYSKYESWDWSDRACGQKVYDYYGP